MGGSRGWLTDRTVTADKAARQRVVVDGSNLATEGRSLPSLAQLDEAVRAFREEHEDDDIIVVVDASFSYRIDESERQILEEAEEAGEIVSPPAGAIGRGDGFLLRIADRTGAVVLSNDSFQEFHGEYKWLFEEGRLIGGKPVPGVGWIFTPRTPVRGPKSRVAVRDAERAKRRTTKKVEEPVAEAIAEATAAAIEPDALGRAKRGRSRGGGGGASPEAVNEPLPFITFIANHRLGSEVDGVVDSFTSHGAFGNAVGARCYAPVVGLGVPPPRSAKEVLTRGETREFIVQALDPPRRGIELALPGLARLAGRPRDETVEAEIDEIEEAAAEVASEIDAEEVEAAPVPAKRTRKKAAAAALVAADDGPAADEAPVKKARTRRGGSTRAADEVSTLPATGAAEDVPTPTPAPTPAEPAMPPMKRASTRTASKRAAAVASEPVEAVATVAAPELSESAPRASSRRTRKTAVPEPEASSAAEPTDEAADAAPVPPARSGPRRSPIKKAATTPGAPSRTAPSEKPPSRRRRGGPAVSPAPGAASPPGAADPGALSDTVPPGSAVPDTAPAD
ncbi:MAG: hypothetical protein QOE93_431, partial [Actinomycetota bacterium]|nr:hypothetical protein [Actinomycetota bacterium]